MAVMSTTTSYGLASDTSVKTFTDAIDTTSTPLVMQTNSGDNESSNSSEDGTELFTLPIEDGDVTEQVPEEVTSDSALVANEHGFTDLSSGEVDTNSVTTEGGLQTLIEEVDGSSTAVSDDSESTIQIGYMEGELGEEEGTTEDVEESQNQGTEERISISQSTNVDDQILTTTTNYVVFNSETGNQDSALEGSGTTSNPDVQNAYESPVDKTETEEYRDKSNHSETPSEVPPSPVTEVDFEEEEIVTIEKKDIDGDFSGDERKIEDNEAHELHVNTTFDALPSNIKPSTATDFITDGSTIEEVQTQPLHAEDVGGNETMKGGVESIGQARAMAEETTETATSTPKADISNSPSSENSTKEETTADSRVATVKLYATNIDKAFQRGSPWFQSLRVHIVESLHGVKSSIYQAATSMEKAVEDLQNVMVSFIDRIHVNSPKGISSDPPNDEPI
ncbi:unnamed protein product [Hydatigera taeniaeformis]|uniref:Uncharacterized protein n=1 Tax=Hydatigena taeniaeformis TaxID=6205 RepID=A0A3P7FGM1_HYDTA|nr:unnamed protein product [Hydatigera taeniaeformis]